MRKRFLLANPFGIGDVLFTTPVIRSLREAFPDALIGYLCNRRVEGLLRANPRIDRVFVFEKDEYRDLWRTSKKEYFRTFINLLREIRGHRFETLIDFSLNAHISFFAMVLGIPKRVGFNYRKRGRFLTRKTFLPGFEEKHMVEYYMELLELLGIPLSRSSEMELFLPESEKSWAEAFLKSRNVFPETPVIGLAPGGGASWGKDASYKQWPPGHFAELANRLSKLRESVFLLFGDPSEAALCQSLAERISGRTVVTAGQTNVSQLSALVARCCLVICNDGGTLHVAVSQDVPTLSFFGPVDPGVYGPFSSRDHHRFLTIPLCCRPCYRRFKYPVCARQVCLEWIEPELAFREASRLLGGAPDSIEKKERSS